MLARLLVLWCAATLNAGCSSLGWTAWTAWTAGSPAPEAGGPALPWGTPPGATGAAATPVAAPDPAYRIGPEDALEISVWRDDTLKATALVRPDGGISFPLVGELQVAGRTAAEVNQEIVRRLARFVPDAEVTVAVVRVASYRVYVIGRVNRPGDIAVGRPIDVLQALSLAGGMTPYAAEDEIRIIRRAEGRQVSLPFDYGRLRKAGDLSQNIMLRSGDVLLVP
jgi:polysaccharide export outer membrane protein